MARLKLSEQWKRDYGTPAASIANHQENQVAKKLPQDPSVAPARVLAELGRAAHEAELLAWKLDTSPGRRRMPPSDPNVACKRGSVPAKAPKVAAGMAKMDAASAKAKREKKVKTTVSATLLEADPEIVTSISGALMSERDAARLCHAHAPWAKDLAWSAPCASWFIWDGTRWAIDVHEQAQRLITTWIAQVYIPVVIDAHDYPEKWIQQCLSDRGLSAIIRQVRHEARINVDLLDADAGVLNTPDGVINLKTFEVEAHDRQHVRKMAGTSLGSKCPRWINFIREITGGDSLLARYLQTAAGYTLTGGTEAHKAFLLVGGGSNGKSVFLKALQNVMGSYAITAEKHVIIETRNEQHPAGVAALEGARLVVVAELPAGRHLNGAQFKSLVSGDEVSARLMRQNFRTFTPQLKLWVTTNSLPRVSDDTDGLWRRIVPIPFSVSFKGSDIDPDLEMKLKAEAPGILAWMIQGLMIYRSEGLVEPPAITDLKATYRAEEDVIGEFREELEAEDEAKLKVGEKLNLISSSEMHAAFVAWAKRHGYRLLTKNNLSRRLNAHGVAPSHTMNCNAYIGWKFKDVTLTTRAVHYGDELPG